MNSKQDLTAIMLISSAALAFIGGVSIALAINLRRAAQEERLARRAAGESEWQRTH